MKNDIELRSALRRRLRPLLIDDAANDFLNCLIHGPLGREFTWGSLSPVSYKLLLILPTAYSS